MKIIDNKKDYYDYLQGILGIDEKVTYDRRNSSIVGESDFYSFEFPTGYDVYFSKKPFKEDTVRKEKTPWKSNRYKIQADRRSYGWSWKSKNKTELEGNIYHLWLEVGYHRFIFEIERYLDENGKLRLEVSIANVKEISKDNKKSKEPLYITQYYIREGRAASGGVENPILKNTWIPGLIPAQDMWNMLYEYISSLNDKEFTDSRTNEQHIESAGFDTKTSFRHRK